MNEQQILRWKPISLLENDSRQKKLCNNAAQIKFTGIVTADKVTTLHFAEFRRLLGAAISIVVAAAGMKVTATRWVGRVGDITFEEIHGLHLVVTDNELDKSESLWTNLDEAPAGLKKNIEVYRKVVGDFEPECVISDFESWAYFFGRFQGLPVISIDNMQIINRCEHDE
jgi:hypothetical protein